MKVSHIVAGGIGMHRVLGCQRNAAHGDDRENTHLKVTQVDHIMTKPSHTRKTTQTYFIHTVDSKHYKQHIHNSFVAGATHGFEGLNTNIELYGRMCLGAS